MRKASMSTYLVLLRAEIAVSPGAPPATRVAMKFQAFAGTSWNTLVTFAGDPTRLCCSDPHLAVESR